MFEGILVTDRYAKTAFAHIGIFFPGAAGAMRKFIIIAVIALAGWGKKLWDTARQRKAIAAPTDANQPPNA